MKRVLAIAGVVLAGCGGTDSEEVDPGASDDAPIGEARDEIVGGFIAPYFFDYVVNVAASGAKSNMSTFGCTGSIVGPKLVLTAAHCVKGANMVTITRHYTYKDEVTWYFAAKNGIVVHPDYDKDVEDGGNDVAIIHLTEPANGLEYPRWRARLPEGVGKEYCDLLGVGYGQDHVGKVVLSVDKERRRAFLCLEERKDNKLTVRDWKGNPCAGDSGGPLLIKSAGTIAGVLSYGQYMVKDGVRHCMAHGKSTYASIDGNKRFLNCAILPSHAARKKCLDDNF